MIVHLLLRWLIGLTALWVMPILLIRPQPYDTRQVQTLLESDCPATCFMGIRPGTTSLDDALQLLKAHEWVQQTEMQIYELDTRGLRGYGTVAWEWSAKHPPQIDSTYPGQLNFNQTFGGSVVESLRIHTHLRPIEVEAWLGPPDAAHVNLLPDVEVGYLLTYRSTLTWNSIKTVLPCPVKLMDYWYSQAEISITPAQRPGNIAPMTDVARAC